MFGWILWFIFTIICMIIIVVSYQEILFDDTLDIFIKLIVWFLMIIGAPFIVINNLIVALLDEILPPGWDDDG